MTDHDKAEYDANVKRARDRILSALPPINRFRKITARLTTNGHCGHVISKGREFYFHKDAAGLTYYCCSACQAEITSRGGDIKVGKVGDVTLE